MSPQRMEIIFYRHTSKDLKKADKHRGKCSLSLIMQEIQVMITMRLLYTCENGLHNR